MPNHKGAIYQKKSCCGCKAMSKGKCVLGYGIERQVIGGRATDDLRAYYAPTEPCPKPRTQKRLDELKSERTYPEG
jgi:hypothetical protein